MVTSAQQAFTLSKVVSPIVEQQLSTTGEAQVIVLLAPTTAAVGLATGFAGVGPSTDLLECFKLTENSRWSQLARVAASTPKGTGMAAAAAAAMAPHPVPVRHYRNLNLLLGSVDREGLKAVSSHSQVIKITGTPQISLIAPTRVAAAKPTAANTWGIERLRVPALWKQGLSGKSVKVAHLDTGVGGKHPALRISVGNEGPGTSRSPGNYTDVVSVGACDINDAVAGFSSSQKFARTNDSLAPHLLAPGVNVISAKHGGAFQAMDGTSMATPHMAGLAALLRESAPERSAEDIEKAIYESCVLPVAIPADRGNRGIPNAVVALKILTGIDAGGVSGVGKKFVQQKKSTSTDLPYFLRRRHRVRPGDHFLGS